jgi:cation-transporting ATPase 13A3/4/5
MACYSFIGYSVSIPKFIEYDFTTWQCFVRSADTLTCAIPPGLPAVLASSVAFTIARMKNQKVYCIQPSRVNISGQIKMFVFDKTGTLTEEGLQVLGHQGLKSAQTFAELNETVGSDMLKAMGVCHNLQRLDDQLVGDPLDQIMFLYAQKIGKVQFKGNDIEVNGQTLAIVKTKQFESKLQRMSVIINDDGGLKMIVKGSPEKIQGLCTGDSLPPDFDEVLAKYTSEGYRVIAFAQKAAQSEDEEEGTNLEFIGILVMINNLKPVSAAVIKELNDADVRTVMATGDNLLTAQSVAKTCNV